MAFPLFAKTVLLGEPCPPEHRVPVAEIDHSPFDTLLGRFVDVQGRVGYGVWKADADAVALYARLTRRQQEVLAALCRGASNRDIAAALAISERTVKVHLNALFTKLGVGNRRAAIAVARQFDPLRTPDTPQQCFVTSPRRGPNGPRTNLGLGRSTQRRMHG